MKNIPHTGSRLARKSLRTTARCLALGVALMLAPPVHAAFRCGNQLVNQGDHRHEVLSKCGEPAFRERRAGAYLEGIGAVDVVERWYYNSGGNRLVRILTFHHGRLRSIETDTRGFNESATRGACQPNEMSIGMSKYELLQRCGEPAARDSWFMPGESYLYYGHHRSGTVLVEEWTYAFGSNRFRRFVRLVDGRVVDIQTGEKGD